MGRFGGLLFVGLAFMLAFADALPSSVEVYYIPSTYSSKISLPSGYSKTYQLTGLCSSPQITVSGRTATCSSTGLITAGTSAGVTNVTVTCDGKASKITVNVKDYSDIYAGNLRDQILEEIIPKKITKLQKLQNITRWVGRNTDYCVNYQGWKSMLIMECGDCWASTSTIIELGTKAGLNVWSRRGNQDGGAGSGHMNAIAFINNTFYIAEAGYSGTRPRGANVYEEPLGFSRSGSMIYQYDGFNTSVIIPATIGNSNITTLGKGKASVFLRDIYELTLPATIHTINQAALWSTKTLSKINIDPENPYFEMYGNHLYTKNRTKLVYTYANSTVATIDPRTETIGYVALGYCKFDTLVLPSTVKNYDLAILYDSTVNDLIIEEGIEYIGETAFQGLHTSKVVLPNSVTSMGPGPFYYSYVNEVILPNNLTEIPLGCFQSSSIKSIDIPECVEIIGEQAFYNCYGLKNITIPTTVKAIGTKAFGTHVKDIYYLGSKKMWKRIKKNYTVPDGTIVHYNSSEDDEEEDPANAGAVVGGIIGAIAGAGLIAAAIAATIAVVKKKKGDSGKSSPAMTSVQVDGGKPEQPSTPRSTPPAPAPRASPPPASRPAPAPRAGPRPAPNPPARSGPATPPRGGGGRPAPHPPARSGPATPPRGGVSRPAPPPRR